MTRHTYFVQPTLAFTPDSPSVFAVQTWAEQVRVAVGEPLKFGAWKVPPGDYTQVWFVGGHAKAMRRVGYGAEDLPTEGISLSGCISQGCVEGIIYNNEFLAMRILDYAGRPMFSLNTEAPNSNSEQLKVSGFRVVPFFSMVSKGHPALITFCMEQKEDPKVAYVAAFPVDEFVGEILQKRFPTLSTSFYWSVPQKAEEAPKEVSLVIPIPEESVASPVTSTKVIFYGRLKSQLKDLTKLAEEHGYEVVTELHTADLVVAPSLSATVLDALPEHLKINAITVDKFKSTFKI
jgi:hypothetical protein